VSRPRTIAELRTRLPLLHSRESLARARDFRARPTDVFIVTYPKSGTTWMQQIVHGLRSGGSMDFAEICEVVPWLETCVDLGIDPDAEQRGSVRAFKSHCTAAEAPTGARFVVVLHEPVAVLRSFHRFFEGWMFEPGAIDLATFAREFFAQGSNSGRYWEHLIGWWARRHEDEVLLLCYEDMCADLPGTIDQVAGWLRLEIDGDTRRRVIEQSSLEFMQRCARQFDDHLLRDARNEACGLPPGGSSGKVRSADAMDRETMLPDAETLALLEQIWAEVVLPATGHHDYASLRAALDGRPDGLSAQYPR
jgi:hypothetical protein